MTGGVAKGLLGIEPAGIVGAFDLNFLFGKTGSALAGRLVDSTTATGGIGVEVTAGVDRALENPVRK